MINVRLVDELFEIYQNRLTGDDEDIDIIAYAVLEESDRNDLMKIVEDMNDEEIQYFISLYLIESLKNKFASHTTDLTHRTKSKFLH
ncbi:DUF6154 family protein [Heyndrickxia vini]|uniref:DUF6154 family protein n=1 Tax=Heyndrickxia vini TaxID=1476025 RepID=UPI003CCD4F78